MASSPAITIFGPTGGSGLATLRNCLRSSSNSINVLCRTPSKLLNLLSPAGAPSNLHIVSGSIYDASAVKACLLHETGSGKRLADIVVSAIGTSPSFSSGEGFQLNPFSGLDYNLCENGIRVILFSIEELKTELANKESVTLKSPKNDPILVAVSGAGISRTERDIPLLLVPLFWLLMGAPRRDKRAMEDALQTSSGQRWIVVRPSLLVGDGLGEGKGLEHVRTWLEREGKPAGEKLIGYTIQREDVGRWIYEECIVGKDFGEKWVSNAVYLTY